jgi:hypothetical protein
LIVRCNVLRGMLSRRAISRCDNLAQTQHSCHQPTTRA